VTNIKSHAAVQLDQNLVESRVNPGDIGLPAQTDGRDPADFSHPGGTLPPLL
jgi:hypothetical protein